MLFKISACTVSFYLIIVLILNHISVLAPLWQHYFNFCPFSQIPVISIDFLINYHVILFFCPHLLSCYSVFDLIYHHIIQVLSHSLSCFSSFFSSFIIMLLLFFVSTLHYVILFFTSIHYFCHFIFSFSLRIKLFKFFLSSFSIMLFKFCLHKFQTSVLLS